MQALRLDTNAGLYHDGRLRASVLLSRQDGPGAAAESAQPTPSPGRARQFRAPRRSPATGAAGCEADRDPLPGYTCPSQGTRRYVPFLLCGIEIGARIRIISASPPRF